MKVEREDSTQKEVELVKSFAFSEGEVFLQAVYLLWLKQNLYVEFTNEELENICNSSFFRNAYLRKHRFATEQQYVRSPIIEAESAITLMKELESKLVLLSGLTITELRKHARELERIHSPLKRAASQQ